MIRPTAPSVASSQAGRKACTGRDFRGFSPPNDSPSARVNYVTAERLYRIAGEMSEQDWAVLNFVSATRLASGRQLARRFWAAPPQGDSAEARAARRTLKRLGDWRVLDPLPRRIGGRHAGSAGMIYGVGVAGAKLLSRKGYERRRLEAPGALYVDHTLAVSELVVALHEADRAGELELIEVQTEPACWRGFIGLGGVVVRLKPDLYVRVGAGSMAEDRWMIEVDLSTEASGTIRAKAKQHVVYWRYSEPVHPRVLWVVPNERRAGQVIDALPREAKQLFAVCLMEEAVAYLAEEARS